MYCLFQTTNFTNVLIYPTEGHMCPSGQVVKPSDHKLNTTDELRFTDICPSLKFYQSVMIYSNNLINLTVYPT